MRLMPRTKNESRYSAKQQRENRGGRGNSNDLFRPNHKQLFPSIQTGLLFLNYALSSIHENTILNQKTTAELITIPRQSICFTLEFGEPFVPFAELMLKAGIVGLPNVGKSTLFNAVTRTRKAEAANYPFCTIDPNVGIVTVPDDRAEVLSRIAGTSVIIPAAVEFVDIAGLVKGAAQGEGLGNKFLTHIREVDAIVQVVRCFEDPDIHHVAGAIDPIRDIETIITELALADLETVKKRREKGAKDAKRGDKVA